MLDLAILKQAAADFRYLLDQGYPREASLALVGNRYDLDRGARQILHRGVFSQATSRVRRDRLRRLAELAGGPLALDGHNVLITLESALQGLPLVAADDGFIRDVAEVSRAYRASAATEAALDLIARYLRETSSRPLTVLYDAPMSKSGELARRTREICAAHGLAAEVAAVPVPERELLALPGVIATSDAHLIHSREIVVDLAGEIILDEAHKGGNFHLILLSEPGAKI